MQTKEKVGFQRANTAMLAFKHQSVAGKSSSPYQSPVSSLPTDGYLVDRIRTIMISTADGFRILGVSGNSGSTLGVSDCICYENQQQPDEVFQDILDRWEMFRQENKFATRYNNPSGFLNMLGKAKEGSSQPFALVVLNDQDVCAVVNGTVGRERSVCKIGPVSTPSPVMQRLAVGGSAFIHDGKHATIEIVSQILENLITTKALDCIEMLNLPVDNPWYDLIVGKKSVIWNSIAVPQIRWQTQLLDQETGERLYFHSSKTRRKQRRQDRILVETFSGDVSLREITEPDQVDGFIDAAAFIVEQTYQAGLGIGIQKDNKDLRDFLVELAENRLLRGYLLEAEGKPIAYEVGDMQSGTFFAWASSYLPEWSRLSPGIVLTNRIMDKQAKEGVGLYDFGSGDAAYKRILGSHRRDEADIILYAKRAIPYIAYQQQKITMYVEAKSRQILTADGINKARRFWRKSLKFKVKK